MVVQHNLQAMNASRMLGITTGNQSKATEKLSSGYRINRAADDAAGLTISEKMRKQIRGLDRASTNAQDGISCVQTAEGALTEVHSMLQRMNELAVQASNGTMSEDDRQAVQDEVDQLITEIDRVSETTKFNEIYLLKGDGTTTAPSTTTHEKTADMTAVYKDGALDKSVTFTANNETAANTDIAAKNWYIAGTTTQVATFNDLKNLVEVGADGNIKFKENTVLYAAAAVTNTEFGSQTTDKKVEDSELAALLKVKSGALYNAAGEEITADKLESYFNDDGSMKEQLQAYDKTGTLKAVGAEQISNFATVTQATYDDVETPGETTTNALAFNLHVGSESAAENKIGVSIEAMSSKGIGIDTLKGNGLMTEETATKSIDTIADAIAKVSKQRSSLGAVQNRLEHTIANLDNVVENTTAAESRIRDTDMADTMVEYSKNNILAQAGQSMLAQANQSTQGVLSLLQ